MDMSKPGSYVELSIHSLKISKVAEQRQSGAR